MEISNSSPTSVLTAWLAVDPSQPVGTTEWAALASEILALARPIETDGVIRSHQEPRKYRLSNPGIGRFLTSASDGRVGWYTVSCWSSPIAQYDRDGAASPGGFHADVRPAGLAVPDNPLSVGLQLRPATLTEWDYRAVELIEFFKRWYVRLGAGAGFVSVLSVGADRMRHGDEPEETSDERIAGWRIGYFWSLLASNLRGVTWGIAVGPELIAKLGDAERLLAQLRPLRAERLATSVWLQLSDSPPLTGEALETLIEREVELQKVLAPVRQWRFHASTLREQYQPKVLDAQTPAPRVKRKSNLLSDDKSDAGTNSSDRELPPIELVDSGELGYAVNLFLSDTPSAGKWRKLQKTVMEWGNLGVSHGFGDGFLHEVGDISHEGNVVRFRIDWGSASPIIAIAYLVEQLHSVDDTQIVRVVLGEQTIN